MPCSREGTSSRKRCMYTGWCFCLTLFSVLLQRNILVLGCSLASGFRWIAPFFFQSRYYSHCLLGSIVPPFTINRVSVSIFLGALLRRSSSILYHVPFWLKLAYCGLHVGHENMSVFAVYRFSLAVGRWTDMTMVKALSCGSRVLCEICNSPLFFQICIPWILRSALRSPSVNVRCCVSLYGKYSSSISGSSCCHPIL